MHTTSFDHKYQVGDQVWIASQWYQPEQVTITRIIFAHDLEQYNFKENRWTLEKNEMFTSFENAQAYYVKERERRLKIEIDDDQCMAESVLLRIKDNQKELTELLKNKAEENI